MSYKDKEYFSQVYDVFNTVIQSSSLDIIAEAKEYGSKYGKYNREINNRIFLRDYFSNTLSSFFYKIIPLNNLFMKKFQWETIILFAAPILLIHYFLKAKERNYTSILTSIGLSPYNSKTETIKELETSIKKLETDLQNFRKLTFPDLQDFEIILGE
ncbi:hypothetical protein [Leptospira kirschneri]|uniref:hypothetical protein n=1 Tax=Leptospira kirschneri TaxID=29507 RepID=UPI00036BFBEC|nr:hypothetical protein [Leptospira kirschneri]